MPKPKQLIDPDPDPEQSTEEKLYAISKRLKEISSSLDGIYELGFIWMQSSILKSLSHIFKSPVQLKAYLLSDGTRSTRDIGKMINVSHQTIKNWWDTWNTDFKIVEQEAKSGSYKKIYSLGDLVAIFGTQQEEKSDE